MNPENALVEENNDDGINEFGKASQLRRTNVALPRGRLIITMSARLGNNARGGISQSQSSISEAGYGTAANDVALLTATTERLSAKLVDDARERLLASGQISPGRRAASTSAPASASERHARTAARHSGAAWYSRDTY